MMILVISGTIVNVTVRVVWISEIISSDMYKLLLGLVELLYVCELMLIQLNRHEWLPMLSTEGLSAALVPPPRQQRRASMGLEYA